MVQTIRWQHLLACSVVLIYYFTIVGCRDSVSTQSQVRTNPSSTSAPATTDSNTASTSSNTNMTTSPENSNTVTTSSTQNLMGCSLSGYTIEAMVGQQNFMLSLSTSSQAVVVAGSNCTKGCNNITPKYTITKTSINENKTLTNKHATNLYTPYWQGAVIADNFSLADTPAVRLKFIMINNTTANNNNELVFQTNRCYSKNANTPINQGIMGLAGSSNSDIGRVVDFWPAAITAKDANFKSFSFMFCDQNGWFWPKGVDTNFLSSSPVYLPTFKDRNNGTYAIHLNSIAIGSDANKQQIIATDITDAVIDTTSPFLQLQPKAYNSLIKAVSQDTNFKTMMNANLFTNNTDSSNRQGPCFTATVDRATVDKSLPSLTLMVVNSNNQTTAINLPATSSYLIPTVDANNKTQYCSGISQNLGVDPVMVIGSALMHNQVYIFDNTNLQLGIAPGKGCAKLP